MFKFYSVFELVSTFVTIFLVSWYLYYRYCFTYWKRKGVPTRPPQFPGGNILKALLGQENLYVAVANYYTEFKAKGYKHAGLYFLNGPVYLPIDPEIVKSILTTDFDHFFDRGVFVDEDNCPLSGHLFALRGSKWKNLRHKLSPSFSSGKIKSMYEIFMDKAENFINAIEPVAQRNDDINIKFVATNYTLDIIFSTSFGLESDALKNPDSYLAKTAITIFNPSNWTFFKTVVLDGFQNPGIILKPLFGDKDHERFFSGLVRNVLKQREENNIVRKDFMALLLEIKEKVGLTFNEILAQCFIFLLAGFETASQTVACCIHSLAYRQHLQDRLRSEIFDKLGKDFKTFTYDDVMNLPYLDQVFNETLRLYPVLGFLHRICVKPYTVPGTDIVIEKDTPIVIPVLGLQRDPEYFPDPLEFDPERFNGVQTQVPFTYLPFGDGPRFCIGRRYGKLQVKLALAALISQFKFDPSPETPKYIKYDKLAKSMVMVPAKGITVKVRKL